MGVKAILILCRQQKNKKNEKTYLPRRNDPDNGRLQQLEQQQQKRKRITGKHNRYYVQW